MIAVLVRNQDVLHLHRIESRAHHPGPILLDRRARIGIDEDQPAGSFDHRLAPQIAVGQPAVGVPYAAGHLFGLLILRPGLLAVRRGLVQIGPPQLAAVGIQHPHHAGARRRDNPLAVPRDAHQARGADVQSTRHARQGTAFLVEQIQLVVPAAGDDPIAAASDRRDRVGKSHSLQIAGGDVQHIQRMGVSIGR